jgi:two-component system CheB/CheR fusion protein
MNTENKVDNKSSETMLRVLIVDDMPDILELLGISISVAGYVVVTVMSAEAALEAARAEPFNFILSDIGMPGMNGYELAQELRKMSQYRHTPMFALTGFSMFDDRARARNSGFTDLLTKPVNPRTLTDLIARHCR